MQENRNLGFGTTIPGYEEITKTGYMCDGVGCIGVFVYTFLVLESNSLPNVTAFNYNEPLDIVKRIKRTSLEY